MTAGITKQAWIRVAPSARKSGEKNLLSELSAHFKETLEQYTRRAYTVEVEFGVSLNSQ